MDIERSNLELSTRLHFKVVNDFLTMPKCTPDRLQLTLQPVYDVFDAFRLTFATAGHGWVEKGSQTGTSKAQKEAPKRASRQLRQVQVRVRAFE